jgi:hypothetical protein
MRRGVVFKKVTRWRIQEMVRLQKNGDVSALPVPSLARVAVAMICGLVAWERGAFFLLCFEGEEGCRTGSTVLEMVWRWRRQLT